MPHYIIKQYRNPYSPSREDKIIFCSENKELVESKLLEYLDLLETLKTKQNKKQILLQQVEYRLESESPIQYIIKLPEYKFPSDENNKIKRKEISEWNRRQNEIHNKAISELRKKIISEMSIEDQEIIKWKSKKDYNTYYFKIEQIVELSPFSK